MVISLIIKLPAVQTSVYLQTYLLTNYPSSIGIFALFSLYFVS